MCEFLKECSAYFTCLSTFFCAVSGALRPLSIGFPLFLQSAKACIATSTVYTARKKFHYESPNWGYMRLYCSVITLFVPSSFLLICTEDIRIPIHHFINQGHFSILFSLMWKLVLIFDLISVGRAKWLISVKYCGTIGSSGVLSFCTSKVCTDAMKNHSLFILLILLFPSPFLNIIHCEFLWIRCGNFTQCR